ncbi:MAG: hypothetical protein AAF485_25905 [Chloroflexota bacterium]
MEADIISDDATLDQIFSNLMGFNKWDKEALDEWVEMMAVHNGNDPALARFTSSEPEMFFIEVKNSGTLRRKQLQSLAKKVGRVNRRYERKCGHPILALMLL